VAPAASVRSSTFFGAPTAAADSAAVTAVARRVDDSELHIDELLAVLASKASMTIQALARRTGHSETRTRARLKALVAAGLAGEFRDGRRLRYWARSSGARPDLGMKGPVLAIAPRIDQKAAAEIGRSLSKGRVLGLLGKGETFAEARLVYRLLYRIGFEEKVKRALLGRLIGPSHEERMGNLYLHARTLEILLFSAENGMRFAGELPARASAVDDLGRLARAVELRPGDLSFDEEEWTSRLPAGAVKNRVQQAFDVRPGAVTPIFFPLWKLLLRRGEGDSFRVETIDALTGMRLDWPAQRRTDR
jgi:hypothetical protein